MDTSSQGLRQIVLMKKPLSTFAFKVMTTRDGGRRWQSVDVASLLHMWVVQDKATGEVWGVFRSQAEAECASERVPGLTAPVKTSVKGNLNVGTTHGTVQIDLQICGEHALLVYDGILVSSQDGGQTWAVTNPTLYVGVLKSSNKVFLYVCESFTSVPYREVVFKEYELCAANENKYVEKQDK